MKKHLQFMSIHDVHFFHCPMFCLSGVPLCGLGAWWIRQTPSGLGHSLVLMKIKSIISQKIKRFGSLDWRLLLPSFDQPGDLTLIIYVTGHTQHRTWPWVPKAVKEPTSSSIWSWNYSPWPYFDLLPGGSADWGSWKLIISRQNILARY